MEMERLILHLKQKTGHCSYYLKKSRLLSNNSASFDQKVRNLQQSRKSATFGIYVNDIERVQKATVKMILGNKYKFYENALI